MTSARIKGTRGLRGRGALQEGAVRRTRVRAREKPPPCTHQLVLAQDPPAPGLENFAWARVKPHFTP